MSNATRQAIATAAASVPGISCTPYFRQTTKAGDAMVRLDRIEYPNKYGGIATWQVLVVLPQRLDQAEKYLEEKAGALVAALSVELEVTSTTPQELVLDNGTKVPVAVIEGTRESE